jgi:hypothetical protein
VMQMSFFGHHTVRAEARVVFSCRDRQARRLGRPGNY